jgi:hypothetical protein
MRRGKFHRSGTSYSSSMRPSRLVEEYIIFITASKILRKFLFLSEQEQSKLIETKISNLGGGNK